MRRWLPREAVSQRVVCLHSFRPCVLPGLKGALLKAERPPEGERGNQKQECSGMMQREGSGWPGVLWGQECWL